MKLTFKILICLSLLLVSCTNDENTEVIPVNPKSVTNCELTIEPDTLVSICANGTDFALRNEIITFASTFYSKNDSPADSEFFWTIESGNMEIINIENSHDGFMAKSIVTVKFNFDFSGNGIIQVHASSGNSEAFTELFVELEQI
ncbi:hypothetical protein [Psychroserpens mesophilus]|uniref:hypothetical protein n=1 Tax=Psychroserpens mesophilus TaxID=325473 RepID=UPI00058EFB9E|nr:hypothetical protein [Psychroserpens mesophilus]